MFTVTGSLRTRWERLENTFVVLEVQNWGSWGNQGPAQSFTGVQSPVFQNFDSNLDTPGSRSGETSLYQVFIGFEDLWESGVGVNIGRKEYNLGTGLVLGNEDFYNCIVYDGIKAWWRGGAFAATGFHYISTERNDLAGSGFSGFSSDDQDLFGLVGSYELGETAKSNLEAYMIRFNDRLEDAGRPIIWTVGGHWWREVKTPEDAEACPFDYNLEIAYQNGEGHNPVDDEDFDIKGSVVEASFGWNLASVSSVHRFLIGLIRQSGDDDQTDDDIESWTPLFPTTHGRFGYTDFFGSGAFVSETGITAYHIGYDLSAGENRHHVGLRVWKIMPTEDTIDFGTSTDEVDDFGTEADLWYKYMYTDNISAGLGVAWLSPDDGLTGGSGAPDDAITRLGGQVKVRF